MISAPVPASRRRPTSLSAAWRSRLLLSGWRSPALRLVGFKKKRIDKMLMMTKEEVKQEMRQQEQSPEIRGAMMRKRRQMARGRMGCEAPVEGRCRHYEPNPTSCRRPQVRHRADLKRLPLSWRREPTSSPPRSAKWQPKTQFRIDAKPTPLARALYRQCEARRRHPEGTLPARR